jgi:23S rRNA pseudouridine2604 synthase
MTFPIRINKYLAEKGICSRREADKLIEEGKVSVNSAKAELGQMIEEEDEVRLESGLKELFYIAYNKPAGIVTNCPQNGEKEIKDVLELKSDYFPVGRLDKESRGLILLSNDGRITDRLLNPRNYHEKEYIVEINRKLQDNDLRQLRQGITLDGGFITKPCEIKVIDDYSFSIVLTEGKNRQIRRMCLALGYDVVDLNRVRIMNIRVDGIREGHYKILSGEVLEELLSELDLIENNEIKQ